MCVTSTKFKNLLEENNLFTSLAPCCEMKEIIIEALELLAYSPEILLRIKSDQIRDGKKKKKDRLLDKDYFLERNNSFFDWIDDVPKESIEDKDVTLGIGRTRMPEIVVYVFMTLRGYLSSMTDSAATNQIRDSITVNCFLKAMNIKLPGRSTINDNLNCISNETRKYIYRKQLEKFYYEGLDNYEKMYIDSTSVKGNTSWPTDACIVYSILLRIQINSQKLKAKFAIENFKNNEVAVKKLRKLKSHLFQINMSAGKANSKKKIKKQYKEFLSLSKKIHESQIKEFNRLEPIIHKADLQPTKKNQLEMFWRKIEDDLSSAVYVIYYAKERIFNGIVLKSTEKILSLSDQTAAFIKKGGRTPVIGYKPQLSKSENGFITSLLVKEGNNSDSSQLIPIFEDARNNTNVLPKVVSTDDGYSSKDGRDYIIGEGVKVVSINGGKGRKLTSDEEWNSKEYEEARNYRSSVESVIFNLKYLFAFGVVRRRGIENVEAEMLEKIITYNFYKSNWIKQRRGKKKTA